MSEINLQSNSKVVAYCGTCHKDVVAAKWVYNHVGRTNRWQTEICSVCGEVISDVLLDEL